jgi:hypothetical protein
MVGEHAREIGSYTLPRFKQFAERCGAELVVIDVDQCPEWPIGNKFAVEHVGRAFERTLFLDIDCWISDDLPDMFERFAAGAVYMHRDRDYTTSTKFLETDAAILGYEDRMLECFNTGVVLFDRMHSGIWSPPTFEIRPTHTLEQSWVEMQCRNFGLNVMPLPVQFNCQWWMRPTEEQWSDAYVRHLANAPHDVRLELLQRWNADLFQSAS